MKGEPPFATVFRPKSFGLSWILEILEVGIMLKFSRHKTFTFIKSQDWNWIVAIPGIRQ